MKPKTYFKKHMNGDYVECIENEQKSPAKNQENPSAKEPGNTAEIDRLRREVGQLSEALALKSKHLDETRERLFQVHREWQCSIR